MTSLTDRLRQHAQLHQQCTVQDDEQIMFAEDLLAAAAEIDQLTFDLQKEWDAVVALKAQVRVLREDAERYRWLRRKQVALSLPSSTVAALVADQSELDAALKATK